MHADHRKKRVPVVHRGQRVPNLYTRSRKTDDHREGDTFEVIFRDSDGKQRQKTLNARSVQRAVAEAEEYRTQVRRGEVAPPARLTFGEVAEEFLTLTGSLVATGERSARTLDLYRQRYNKHIAPTLARRRVHDLRAEHIGAVFAEQRRVGLAPYTISGTQTIISAVLTFGLSRGYLLTNPLVRLSRMEKPRQESRRTARRLTDEEVRRLCAATTPRYRPVVMTLAWTGVRVSEALALHWEDIDFEAKEVRIRFQLDEKGGSKKPKTRAAVRCVPLLPVLEQELRNQRKAQLAHGLSSPQHLVFSTATGKPLDRHNVRNKGIVVAANKAGLHGEDKETVTTHDLRRTFISHLIVGLGLDPVRVSKIAGHSNVSVTLNVYADEFDKAMHRYDLMDRIARTGFGAA